MSEIKLNLVDAERILHGTIHGSVADTCVAALSAEPETIAELEAALSRYIRPLDSTNHFAWFHSVDCPTHLSLSSEGVETVGNHCSGLDTKPWDAGIVVIDLAARIVAIESTYSQPGPEGKVFYHDGHAATDIPISYRVPDDWLFVNSVDAYQWSRERRARERAGKPRFDARSILFGRPLLEFIVNAGLSLPNQTWSTFTSPSELVTDDDDEAKYAALAKDVSIIHARWLLSPREDLRGESPRDVLLAHQDFIDFDLQTRSEQWSLLNEGPPCLDGNSFAYRFAGFGTHEWVLYYDLVRHLIWSLVELKPSVSPGIDCGSATVDQLIATLDQIKTDWLENPLSDLEGRVPAIIIDNERKRLPQAMTPHDMIIDDDCPICQMFGDETSPLGMGVGFWHLDSSSMDDDFAFSSFKTRQEWEAENHQREELYKELDRKGEEREARIARGEALESDRFFDPKPIGAGWGWFDPQLFPDGLNLEPTGMGDTHIDDSDDSDETDSN